MSLLKVNDIQAASSGNTPVGIIQVKHIYLTSTSSLTSSGAFHELTTDLRLAFTPKRADSTLMMEFFACFYCDNFKFIAFIIHYFF